MIFAVVFSILLSFVHSLQLLKQWILWENQHPSIRSKIVEHTPNRFHFFIRQTKSSRTIDECKKAIFNSNYPSTKLLINESDTIGLEHLSTSEEKYISVSIDSDVTLTNDWLKSINDQAQYPYLHAFQTPVLYNSSLHWKDRVNLIRSLKYVLHTFRLYQHDKETRFERTIFIQKTDSSGKDQELTYLTNPEFISYSSLTWNNAQINEPSFLLRFYPLYIFINLLLGIFINPVFGFVALLLIFIYAIVDYLVVSKLAAFYEQPNACKWYILSFIFSLVGYRWLPE